MKKNFNCFECEGSGLIENNLKVCKICKGKKCFMCKESGYEQLPMITCKKCIGTGYNFEICDKKILKELNNYMK